jgi:hypothetical protein
MNVDRHRQRNAVNNDDDDNPHGEDGELNSSDNESEEDDNDIRSSVIVQPTSQSWTTMLNEQNLSSIMSNALADHSQIIHIDDPIAQQSTNPLTYVFPPGTNIDEYFQRKRQNEKSQSTHTTSRRDLKNLSKILHKEKNTDLLRIILDILGKRRTFQYAQQAIEFYRTDNQSIKKCDNGQQRTLGGVFFKMLINDDKNEFINDNEREQIKRRNQQIQKEKKKQQQKKKNNNNNNSKSTINVT